MKVVVEDDPGVDLQAFLLTAVVQRLGEDVVSGGGLEDGEPIDNGRGDEVGLGAISCAVVAAHAVEIGRGETEFQARGGVPKALR